jgi:hypothetical protein
MILSDSIGYAGVICWLDNPIKQDLSINTKNQVKISVKVLSICWVVSAVIVCTINILLTSILVKQLSGENMIAATKYSAKLKWFPISQTVCFIPFFINRILEAIYDEEIFILYLVENIFFCSRGFIYSVIFGYTSKIKSNVVYSMRNFINNRKETENPEVRVQLERLDTLSESTYDEKNEIEIRNFSFTSTSDFVKKTNKHNVSLNSGSENSDDNKKESNVKEDTRH